MSKQGVYLVLAFATATGFAQYPNVRVSSPSSNDPEEVTIAINPANPQNLAAGANIRYYFYSTNGGLSWVQGQLGSTYGVWGDPCTVFDHLGNLYFGHLSNPPSPGYWIDRIVVQKSTNGGATWNNGVGVGFSPPVKNQDKEWLASDMTDSPYRGNVYMAWTEFDDYGSSNPADSTRILFARTTDQGTTWSAPVRVSDLGGNCVDEDNTVEGAVPCVGPDGTIYTTWSGPAGLMFDRSTDGGVTWGSDIFVSAQPGGWDFSIPGISRANGMPVTACDISNSPHRGAVYVCWSDQRNGLTDTDIFLVKSTDGGQTWGSVRRVNNDLTTRHQFFQWMTIDQTSGYLYCVFYDRRATSGNATDVYMARSTDGGETFSNFKVSQSSFVPQSGVFFGDYTNIAAMDGKIYPIWMRLDGSALSVWTALVTDSITSTYHFPVDTGWNLLSLPVSVDDARTGSVYPDASSDAYIYSPWSGYSVADTLKNGSGYWLKFPAGQQITMAGIPLLADTLAVAEGWNLIGTLTTPVPVSTIVEIPGGIIGSEYFAYTGAGYVAVTQLDPGKGYWVKSSGPGTLILSSAVSVIPTNDDDARYKTLTKRWH